MPFRNKTFLFFKIESWNFQVQFESEFRETSQNFNSIRQPIKKDKNNICLNRLNELKICEVSWIDFKLNLKVSAFYLEKKKSFIPEKKIFKPLSISKQKSFVYWPNFQWKFWSRHGLLNIWTELLSIFLADVPTWGGDLGPKLHPGGGFFGPWFFII